MMGGELEWLSNSEKKLGSREDAMMRSLLHLFSLHPDTDKQVCPASGRWERK